MITLHAYSPWNGYPDLASTLDCGTLYELGEYAVDPSSYTLMADAVDVAKEVARMIGAEPVRFALGRGATLIEADDLGKAFDEILNPKSDAVERLKSVASTLETAKGQAMPIDFNQLAADIRKVLA